MRYIYALMDPRYGEVRYIGESADPWTRVFLPYVEKRPWQSHVAEATSGVQSHKASWIRGLIADGFMPTVVVLDSGDWDNEETGRREVETISFYKSMGAKLVNKSGGGERSTHRAMTPELKARISAATKAAMARPEVRKKVSDGLRGKPSWNAGRRTAKPRPRMTDEQRAESYRARGRKIAEKQAARWASMTDERREEIGAAMSAGKRRAKETSDST